MNFFASIVKAVGGPLYAYPISIAIIIIGAAVALKAGSKWGWAILSLGILCILATMRVNRLV